MGKAILSAPAIPWLDPLVAGVITACCFTIVEKFVVTPGDAATGEVNA